MYISWLLARKEVLVPHRAARAVICVGLLLSVLIACAQPVSSLDGPVLGPLVDWESGLYLGHEMVGSIWDARNDRFVSVAELTEALDSARYVLLGEKHDNPDHHRIQRNVLAYLIASNRVASVAFEMMDSDFDDRLALLEDQQFVSQAQLKDYLQWDEEGWDWASYGPIISDTKAAGIEILSANISRTRMGEVYGQPLDPSVANVLDEQAIGQLNIEIDESHCHLLPPSQFPAMVRVQQARDHAMAGSLSAIEVPGRANVLIAGNYHIRQDLGVPNYLLDLQSTTRRSDVLALAILEVSPLSNDPSEYLQAYSDLAPFDFVWFTPAISNEDYCASLTDQ